MSNHNEQMIGLLEEKTKATTNRLDRNWIYQFLLASLGLTFLLSPDTATEIIKETPLKMIPAQYFYFVIPALLLYLFIHFGYLLNHFLDLRRIYERKAHDHFKGTLDNSDTRVILEKQTLFEPLHLISQGKVTFSDFAPFSILLLLGSFAIILNHVVCLGTIAIYMHGSMRIITIVAVPVILTACYIQFYYTQKECRLMKGLTVLLYVASAAFAIALTMKIAS